MGPKSPCLITTDGKVMACMLPPLAAHTDPCRQKLNSMEACERPLTWLGSGCVDVGLARQAGNSILIKLTSGTLVQLKKSPKALKP